MKKLYLIFSKSIILAFLFVISIHLSAQELNLIKMINTKPVAVSQNSLKQSPERQTSVQQTSAIEENKQDISSPVSYKRLQTIAPVFGSPSQTISLEKSGTLEAEAELAFSCDGKPVGTNDTYLVQAGQSLVVAAPGLLANDIDPDEDAIFVSNFFAPSHGTLTSVVTSGAFTYVLDDGYTGTDEFQYVIRDVNGNFSDPVAVNIEVVEPFNRKPLGFSDQYIAFDGTPLVVTALGLRHNDLDPDGDDIFVSNFFQPSHGTLTSIVTSGAFTYVPEDGFTRTDEFQYTLRDAENNFSEPVNVSIEVLEPLNRNPIGNEDHLVFWQEQTWLLMLLV